MRSKNGLVFRVITVLVYNRPKNIQFAHVCTVFEYWTGGDSVSPSFRSYIGGWEDWLQITSPRHDRYIRVKQEQKSIKL